MTPLPTLLATAIHAVSAALGGSGEVNTWRAWLSSTQRSTLGTLAAMIVVAALLGLWRERSPEAAD